MTRLKCSVVVLLFLSGVFTWCEAPRPGGGVSHEEAVVRETYGKLTFAANVGLLVHATLLHSEGWPSITDEDALRKAMSEQIQFDLSGFQVGTLSDVRPVKWTSLVTTFP